MGKIENNYKDRLDPKRSEQLNLPIIHKIPYIRVSEDISKEIPVYSDTFMNDWVIPEEGRPPVWEELRTIRLKPNRKTDDVLIQMYQRGQTINKIGRLRGNMEYLEDKWNVQIQPIAFKYVFLNYTRNPETIELTNTDTVQSKIRDKYLKIRVRYDGTQYVMINAIKTKYTISHA